VARKVGIRIKPFLTHSNMAKHNSNHSDSAVGPRRSFLKLFTTLGGIIAAAMVAVPGVGYLAAAVARRKEEPWVSLGPVSTFPKGETRLKVIKPADNPLAQSWDGVSAQTGVYVRYLGRNDNFKDQFHVFAINCTHLGCPVEWFPQSGLFMCPCHGGVYYEDGERASGPPPRGLYHCVWQVEQKQGDAEPQLYVQAPFLPTLGHTLTGKNET
jgi:menaquinol-cytochrome c reductase iron-sulfur subunit